MDHSLGLSGKQQGWQRWVQTLAAPSGKLRRWHEHSSMEPWTPTPCLVRGFLWASSLLKKLHRDQEDLAAFVIATWALWKCSWALNKDVIHAMLSLFYSPLLWEKVCHLESSDDVRPLTLVMRDDSRRTRAETFFLVGNYFLWPKMTQTPNRSGKDFWGLMTQMITEHWKRSGWGEGMTTEIVRTRNHVSLLSACTRTTTTTTTSLFTTSTVAAMTLSKTAESERQQWQQHRQ